jgi:hypothetical protein
MRKPEISCRDRCEITEPTVPADAPSAVNTMVRDATNGSVFTTERPSGCFPLVSGPAERAVRYPGTSGRTQGETNETRPATNAAATADTLISGSPIVGVGTRCVPCTGWSKRRQSKRRQPTSTDRRLRRLPPLGPFCAFAGNGGRGELRPPGRACYGRCSAAAAIAAAALVVAVPAAARQGANGAALSTCGNGGNGPAQQIRFATGVLPRLHRRLQPSEIMRLTLAGVGARRLLRGGHLGPPPARMQRLFERDRDRQGSGFANPLWLYLDAPLAEAAKTEGGELTPSQTVLRMRANWVAALAAGAVRDQMCLNGWGSVRDWYASLTSPPPVGYAQNLARNQAFPNLAPFVLRRRVLQAARKLRATAVSLVFRRPLQLAPDVTFRVADRFLFMKNLPRIARRLDPNSSDGGHPAFEGVFIEARDRNGVPFFAMFSNWRGNVVRGIWARTPCHAALSPTGVEATGC